MKTIVICLFIILSLTTGTAYADILIIKNKNVQDDSLSAIDVKKIYLGKKKKWKDQSKINFVTLSDSDIHRAFLKTYIKKTSKQFKYYWKKMLFTGKSNLPRCFKTTAELMEYVANTEGAIGYIDSNTTIVNVNLIDVK